MAIFTMEVQVGPNVQALMRIIEAVIDLSDLVPEWNGLERDEAVARVTSNVDTMLDSIGARRNDGARDGGDLP